MEGYKETLKTSKKRDKGISKRIGWEIIFHRIFANLFQIQPQPQCNRFLGQKMWPRDSWISLGNLFEVAILRCCWARDWYNTGSTMYCCTTALLGAGWLGSRIFFHPWCTEWNCLNIVVLDDAGCAIFHQKAIRSETSPNDMTEVP